MFSGGGREVISLIEPQRDAARMQRPFYGGGNEVKSLDYLQTSDIDEIYPVSEPDPRMAATSKVTR